MWRADTPPVRNHVNKSRRQTTNGRQANATRIFGSRKGKLLPDKIKKANKEHTEKTLYLTIYKLVNKSSQYNGIVNYVVFFNCTMFSPSEFFFNPIVI